METYVGLDVSKNDLNIYHDGSRKSLKIRNTLPAIQEWLKKIECEKRTIKLLICEATGGYESLVVKELKKAGFPVHVAHANKVRYFAKTTGVLAKTDKIDSRLLSTYARLFQPSPDEQEIAPETQELQFFVKRRSQLIKQKVEESNRLDKLLPLWMKESIEQHIKWIEEQIKDLEKKLQFHVETYETLHKKATLLSSIPGVGLVTCCTLLAGVPELGTLSSKSLAALIGVAPFNKDSGRISKKRAIQAGRAPVRVALYMATVASLIHNPYIKNFYRKLEAKGKPSKVALVACMRKLLTILNSVMKRKTIWLD